jgi:hypothetical protein
MAGDMECEASTSLKRRLVVARAGMDVRNFDQMLKGAAASLDPRQQVACILGIEFTLRDLMLEAEDSALQL